jgi:hypothetical protein
MPDPLGSLCIVLHGHLPYVLNHGTYPHGEAWLYEAAAETYLPLLNTIGDIALNGARPAFTIGLTPVLLEQLSNDHFKAGFIAYLNERLERARRDRAEFAKADQPHFVALAERWEQWYGQALATFERIGQGHPARVRPAVSRGAYSTAHQQRHPRLHAAAAQRPDDPRAVGLRHDDQRETVGGHQAAGDVAAGMRLPADLPAVAAGGAV